jgi:hypothetical protein
MKKPEWVCVKCDAVNLVTGTFCEACGEARDRAPSSAARAEYLPPWKRPGWKDSTPEDRCTEPGCDKRIRDHIDEFKRAGEKIVARAVKL